MESAGGGGGGGSTKGGSRGVHGIKGPCSYPKSAGVVGFAMQYRVSGLGFEVWVLGSRAETIVKPTCPKNQSLAAQHLNSNLAG